ncbi:hypothetical protein DYB37_006905 [Aphanomyces astaci]|uniref:Uncharacterized protein n=1 Tax=Aphanomyces astaci TaxID=112090 RepID=A0A397CCR0_APHAT|nr:hypothetical protein AaE_014855 [Aphanomyces astaci]RHY06935.1 hypothetical protein DYB25_002831 [Aphanomyces astaci]RHY43316.1 hypothetical protein DYB38_012119 [Aphanomyces astaci]RHY51296.1 hypothetical protein DYB34_010877 [Aphanomyces astaci]RHY55554.1 hypothetical protein DYB30_012570 [Aphanomyces astaci]
MVATTTIEKSSLKAKVSSWFKTITKASKCTCPYVTQPKPSKAKKSPYVVSEPIAMPRKYANETKLTTVVGGHRVPYIPSQVSQLREGRRSYDPIEETHVLCSHCQAQARRHTVTSMDDDDDY